MFEIAYIHYVKKPVSVDLSPVVSFFGATCSELLLWQYDREPFLLAVNKNSSYGQQDDYLI